MQLFEALVLTDSTPGAPDEPHAPQIKRDDETRPDVGGAYAGPFNEAEELRLVCEVHGGALYNLQLHEGSFEALLTDMLSPRAAAAGGVLVRGGPAGGGPHPDRARQGRGRQQAQIQNVGAALALQQQHLHNTTWNLV